MLEYALQILALAQQIASFIFFIYYLYISPTPLNSTQASFNVTHALNIQFLSCFLFIGMLSYSTASNVVTAGSRKHTLKP